MPYSQGWAVARSWRWLTATVQFGRLAAHTDGAVAAIRTHAPRFADRFNGAKAPTNCAQLER